MGAAAAGERAGCALIGGTGWKVARGMDGGGGCWTTEGRLEAGVGASHRSTKARKGGAVSRCGEAEPMYDRSMRAQHFP